MIIPSKQYAQIMEVLPILCVDIIIQNSHNEYLLIKRINEPRKEQWWVIGGRVLKGEALEQAAIRKLKEEVGLKANNIRPIGYYEDTMEISPFGNPTPLHSVSVVFKTFVDDFQNIILDSQSSAWKYSRELPKDFILKPFSNDL
jgi:colanic acid biosynthesis protein WcaH